MLRYRSRDRLDPIRWRRPRPATIARAVLVIVLLTLAATTLSTQPGRQLAPAAGDRGSDSRTAGSPGLSPPRSHTPAPPADSGNRADGGDDGAHDGAGAADRGAANPLPVPPGLVGVPIKLADQAAAGVVHRGDHVDLVALARDGEVVVVAANVLVLGSPSVADAAGSAVLYLALTETQSRRVAGLARHVDFSIRVRPP